MEVAVSDEVRLQAAHHRREFAGLHEWDVVWKATVDWAGDEETAIGIGLDQHGHFGPNGSELIADRLVSTADGPLACVVELGSGFGGSLRQIGRNLRSHGYRPSLIGVELVPEHCALAEKAGRSVGDTAPDFLNADVRQIPLPPSSVDAAFATGSASHFAAMAEVLAECHRVLRPGGVLAMTEEVSLRPDGGPEVGAAFLDHHPPDVFRTASPEQRRAELEAAGFAVEAFESLRDWAVPLLRQRVQALRLLENCTKPFFGSEAYESLVGTLTYTADEYERGSIEPTLIVARRPA